MPDLKKLKCECCKCYDSFDGCTAFDCQYDFEISVDKVHEAAKAYQLSPEFIMSMLVEEKARIANERMKEAKDQYLADNFDPETDSEFLISFADATVLEKKRLVELDTEQLLRLKAEVDHILNERDDYNA